MSIEENPYQPPAFTEKSTPAADLDFGAGSPYPSRKELEAFVGKKAGYYLARWTPALDFSLSVGGFNWAAFFLSILWLAYRKMYRLVFIFIGILVVESVLEELAIAGGLWKEESLTLVGRIFGFALSIVCAKFGNGWYLSHARRQIATIRSRGEPDDLYYTELARRGGTNILAPLGLIIVLLAVGFGVAVALEVLFPGE